MNKRSLGLLAGAWLLITGSNLLILPARHLEKVDVESVFPHPLPLVVRAPGALEAKESITLKAQFDGPILKKLFKEGQMVKKNDLLAEIGRERIRVEYQSRTNAVKNAETDIAKAKRELKLQKALFKREAVAYSAVEEAERVLARAQQDLASAREALRLEQIRWNAYRVTAPFNGTIIKDALQDEKFAANNHDLLTIADVSEFTVRARLDELDITGLREGLPAEVRISIFPDIIFPAAVTQIGSQSASSEGTDIPVVLRLKDTRKQPLRPKLTAEARIATGNTEALLSIPLTAIVNTDAKPKAWVLTAANRLQLRPLTLGRSNPERIEVKEGLKAGDRICVQAQAGYAEGMKVLFK